MPAFFIDGLKRACTDYKYAFFGPNYMQLNIPMSLPCHLVPLPEYAFRDQWAFIVSKNSPYKTLINWRLENKIYSIPNMTDD
jgi:hypothetical protein